MPVNSLSEEQEKKAKLLRAQGIPFANIAKDLGVKEGLLRSRASRHNWTRCVTEADKFLQQRLSESISSRMDREIEDCIGGAIELAKEGLNGLRNNKTRTMKPKDLREYAGALRELVQVQRQALGMSEKASTQVNIGIVDYGSVSQGGQPSSEAPADQTIDIE